MAKQRASPAMLWLTIVAAPAALGFESVLRWVLFPPEFDDVRAILNEPLTPVAWVLACVAAIASVVGMSIQRRVAERRLAKLPPQADLDARYRVVFSVFLLTTAVPQIPAILSTFTFMFGASFTPVACSIAISSVGVVAQALRVPRLAASLISE